jgi:transposase-like protein
LIGHLPNLQALGFPHSAGTEPGEKVGSRGGKRRHFDPEFRAGAVRIVKETGRPVAQIARDLDITPYTLHNCVQMDRLAKQNGSSGGALQPEYHARKRAAGGRAQ